MRLTTILRGHCSRMSAGGQPWEQVRWTSSHPIQRSRVNLEITHADRLRQMESLFLVAETVEPWQFHMVQPSILK